MLGCYDEDALETPSVAFYPDRVGMAKELDGKTYTIQLQTTGYVKGAGRVQVAVTNSEYLETTPAIENGIINVDFENQQTYATISVNVGDDDLTDGYESVFSFVGVAGGIKSYTNTEYTLFVSDNDKQVLFLEDFESNSLSRWTTYSGAGSNDWGIREFSSNMYAVISNFQNDEPGDDWLISPSFNFNNFENEALSFMSQTAFNDDNLLEVVILKGYDSGDPTSNIVKTLSPELDPHRGGGFGNFTFSGDLDLSDIEGVAQIAFHYKANSLSDGSQWQIDDVELTGINTSGITSITSLEEDFELASTSGNLSITGWKNISESGSVRWRAQETSGNTFARMSAANSGEESNISWLITPLINFGALNVKAMSFDSQIRFADDAALELYYSNDFDGDDVGSATWTELNYNIALAAPEASSGWVNSGNVDLSTLIGEGYIAFKYIGSGTNFSLDAQYQLDNIVIGQEGGGNNSSDEYIFFDDFEGCAEDYATPSNFIEEFVAGSKTDRGWGCRSEGVDGSRGVRASAFGGEDGTDNAWLITASKIDLSNVSTAYLSMYVGSDFDGEGELRAYWSIDYVGSGDPTTASWTELSDFTSQLPSKGTGDFSFVISDLSSAVGSEVYVALQYNLGTSSGSASFEIDNFMISETQPEDTGSGTGGSGGNGNTGSGDIYSQDFNDCTSGFPSDWVVYSVASAAQFDCSDDTRGASGNSGDYAAEMNNYQSDAAADDWLISPAINLGSGAELEFNSLLRYEGSEVTVMISTDYTGSGDPSSATWNEFSIATEALDADVNSWDFQPSGALSLDAYTGIIYVGFHFTSIGTESGETGTFRIDDFKVSSK